MDKKLDGYILDYIVRTFIEKNMTWNHGITNQKETLKNVTIGEMYNRMLEYKGQNMDARKNILNELHNILVSENSNRQGEMKDDIKNMEDDIRNLKDDIKNLNDKLTVLIDALSIIDQKITKS